MDPDDSHDTEQSDQIIAVAESGRPFEQQTALERMLRALLYQPTERLKRAELALPGHVRRKEYAAASDCQETIRRSKQEIQQWENLLGLYEAELQGA